MDKNITIGFGQIICPLSFGTNHYIPILGYLGAEALRAKERTTRCCRCVTLEFGWLAKPWAITVSRVLSKKSNLHRKLVTAALDIWLLDNRYTWEDIPLFCRVQGKEPRIYRLIKIVGWDMMGPTRSNTRLRICGTVGGWSVLMCAVGVRRGICRRQHGVVSNHATPKDHGSSSIILVPN